MKGDIEGRPKDIDWGEKEKNFGANWPGKPARKETCWSPKKNQ